MDVSDPARGLAPGLTMPILRTLAARSSPASAAQLTRIGGVGTEAGVRRAVERLSAHGICLSEEIGGRVVYSLNYDHVLWAAVDELLRADGALRRRLSGALAEWDPEPVTAVLFGSSARRDGDVESDVDLLIVRPALRTDRVRRDWARQVHELRGQVRRWTGNHLQVLEWSQLQARRNASRGEDIVDDVLEEGVLLHGKPFAAVLERAS